MYDTMSKIDFLILIQLPVGSMRKIGNIYRKMAKSWVNFDGEAVCVCIEANMSKIVGHSKLGLKFEPYIGLQILIL